MGSGTQCLAVVMPIHLLDWEMPAGVGYDNIQVQHSWSLTFAACDAWLSYCGNSNTYTLSATLGDYYVVSGTDNAVSDWPFLEPGTVSGAHG